MPPSSLVSGIALTATASQRPAVIPRKMPTPPKSGVALSCHRSAEGAATRRRANGQRSSRYTVSAEAGRAAAAVRVLTRREGSGAVLGLCLPAQSVPTLVRDDDGLRRSASLPRALCEPVPPGLPGEVQGLAARRPLVAPQPARPARRLPGRLRADLPEQEHLSLPRVPARGPRLLDLLLGLAAVGVARRWSTARS